MKAEIISNFLEEKRIVLKEFLEVTESLKIQCDLEQWETIPQFIHRRQELIQMIHQIDRKIQENGWEWNGQRKEAQTLQDLQGILRRIKILDDQCFHQISHLCERIKEELLGVRNGLKTIHGYMRRSTFQPRFLDLRR